MRSYQRPSERHVSVPREDAGGRCPACGSSNVKKYPVVSEGGWWTVTKCQDCLHSLERTRSGSRLGPMSLLSDLL